MIKLNRRRFNQIAIIATGAMGTPVIAAPAGVAEPVSSSNVIRSSGSYNYRLRYVRRGRRLLLWTYVTRLNYWDAAVDFTLRVSSDPKLVPADAADTSTLHTASLKSTSLLSHTNRLTVRIAGNDARSVYLNLNFGPEKAVSRIWEVKIPAKLS